MARWANTGPAVNEREGGASSGVRKHLCSFHEEIRTTGKLFQFMLEIRLITIPQEKINPLLL